MGPSQSRLSLVTPLACGDGATTRITQLEVDLLGRPGSEPRHRRGRILSAELGLDVGELDLRLGRPGVLREITARAAHILPPGTRRQLEPEWLHVFLQPPSEPGGRPELRVLARLASDGGAPVFCALRLPLRLSRPVPRGPQKPNEPLGLGLGLDEVLVFGAAGAPAGRIALGVVHALALGMLHRTSGPGPLFLSPTDSEPPPGLRLVWAHGLHEVGVDLLSDALLTALPEAGYRAPDGASAALASIRLLDGTGTEASELRPGDRAWLALGYRTTGRGDSFDDGDRRVDPNAGPPAPGLSEPIQIGDRLLLAGDVVAALASYDLAAQSSTLRAVALARRRQILLTAPSRHAEAEALCLGALDEDPGDAGAKLGLAQIATARGDLAEAVTLYRELAEGPERSTGERALALLSAARCALEDGTYGIARETAEAARACIAQSGEGSGLAPIELAVDQVLGEALARQAAPPPFSLKPRPRTGSAPGRRPEPPLAPEHAALLERLAQLPAEMARTELLTVLQSSKEPPRALLLKAAALSQELNDLVAARRFLGQAGDHPEALHARARLDMPELLQAAPGSPEDLLPTLVRLHQRGYAQPEEQRALARLLSARGQHRDALTAQLEAGLDPDALLTQLEAAGQPAALVDALVTHARVRTDADAAGLYRRAAEVAQQQLGDLVRAVALWEAAAEALKAQGREADAAALFAHAGHLHHGLGSYDRAEASLRLALELGGERTQLVLLGLGHHAYAHADLDAAEGYYRRALAADQVPTEERPHVHLRLAEIAHQRGDLATEEATLSRAIEEGGGALAWPALAALFSSLDDKARYGAALLMWATYESGDLRRALLLQASALCGPSLRAQVDAALIACDSDDEVVRARAVARLRVARDLPGLASLLRRDIERSEGPRRLASARELLAVALRLKDLPTAAAAHVQILDELGAEARPEDVLAALRFLTRHARDARGESAPLGDTLRARLLASGALSTAQAQLDRQLALLTDEPAERPLRARLLWQAAELCELLGDPMGAAGRWLRLCSLDDEGTLLGADSSASPVPPVATIPPGDPPPPERTPLARARRLLRRLARDGHGTHALMLCEAELRRLGTRARRAAGLSLLRAELLAHLGRAGEALGQLELLLVRAEELGPLHALLGMLLCSSPSPAEAERALPHLLTAAYARDVEPAEAGECALLAASLLMAASDGASRPGASAASPSPSSTTTTARPQVGYLERAPDLGFVAVPTDFLAETSDEPLPASQLSPVLGPPLGPDFAPRDEAPPEPASVTGPVPTPAELLERAARLLVDDPRPVEQQLTLALQRGDLYQALAFCDRLLSLLRAPRERAKVLCEKAAVLRQLPTAGSPEPLLHEALALCPDFPPALRALRELLTAEGDDERALQLLDRELRSLQAPEDAGQAAASPEARAELHRELARLLSNRGDEAGAMSALRSAGQLGSEAALRQLAEELAKRGDWLGAADAAGRAATRLPAGERAAVLLSAASWAERADDELRARAYLSEAAALGGPAGIEAADRLLRLDGGPDATARRRALERRLQAGGDSLGHLMALRRLIVLCCQEGDGAATERYAQALLAHVPEEPLALAALAERAFATGRPALGTELLLRLPQIPADYPSAGALLRSLGASHERSGNLEGAEQAYAQAAPLCDAHGDTDGAIAATAALLRLREGRGALAEALEAAKQLLLHLPAGGSDERTAARLRAAELAERLGDRDEAEQQLGCLLDETPGHAGALRRLMTLHRRAGQPEEARGCLDELLQAGELSADEKAALLRERAALDEALSDLGAALHDLEASLELAPDDPPTLRRVIGVAARLGDGARAARATARLEALRAPLGGVEVVAGLALLLPGAPEGQHGLRLLQAGPADARTLASALAELGNGQAGASTGLDGPLAAAVQALGGDAGRLVSALTAELLGHEPERARVHLGAARALARLVERHDPKPGAEGAGHRVSLAVLAFVDPTGEAAQRLERTGPQPVPLRGGALPSPAAELRPWLELLELLGGSGLGAPAGEPATGERDPVGPQASQWTSRLLPLGQRVGFPRIQVELVDSLPEGEAPAACDPTRPPRLRLSRHLLAARGADAGPVHFAALRAFHRLAAGEALLRDPEDLLFLVRAAAALYLPGVEAEGARCQELLGALRALALQPGPRAIDPAKAAAALPPCLAQLEADPLALRRLAPALRAEVELRADASALCGLGDLLAALRALTPPDAEDPPERLLALPRLGALLRLALRVLGT